MNEANDLDIEFQVCNCKGLVMAAHPGSSASPDSCPDCGQKIEKRVLASGVKLTALMGTAQVEGAVVPVSVPEPRVGGLAFDLRAVAETA